MLSQQLLISTCLRGSHTSRQDFPSASCNDFLRVNQLAINYSASIIPLQKMATQLNRNGGNDISSTPNVAEDDAPPTHNTSPALNELKTPAAEQASPELDEKQVAFVEASEPLDGNASKCPGTLCEHNGGNKGESEKYLNSPVLDAGTSGVANTLGKADGYRTTGIPKGVNAPGGTDVSDETKKTDATGQADAFGQIDARGETDAPIESEAERDSNSLEASAENAVKAATDEVKTDSSPKWEPSEDEVQKMRAKLLKRGGWDAIGLEGGDQFREYMQYKNRKLRDQFAHEADMNMKRQDKGAHKDGEASKGGRVGSQKVGDVFQNVVVWVDGRTNPGRLEIRNIVMRNGGQFETYWTSQVTHVVADTLAAATAKRARTLLAASPSSGLKKGNANLKMVTAQWVSQSLKMKKRLPEWQFPIPGVQLPGQKSVAALLRKRPWPPVKKSQTDCEPTSDASSCVKRARVETPEKRMQLKQKSFFKR